MLNKDLIKKARQEKGISLGELSEMTGIAKSTLQRYETGDTKKIPAEALSNIEKALQLTNGQLFGWGCDDLSGLDTTPDYVEYAVIGDVAAGYEHIATEDWAGDKIKIPTSFLVGHSKEDYFVLRVKGDSMFPQFQDGDKVLVLKQSAMDYSGQIGVVIYGDENATLKKVEYKQGENWLRLVPINPNLPSITIKNENLEHCHVLGVPKCLLREF